MTLFVLVSSLLVFFEIRGKLALIQSQVLPFEIGECNEVRFGSIFSAAVARDGDGDRDGIE